MGLSTDDLKSSMTMCNFIQSSLPWSTLTKLFFFPSRHSATSLSLINQHRLTLLRPRDMLQAASSEATSFKMAHHKDNWINCMHYMFCIRKTRLQQTESKVDEDSENLCLVFWQLIYSHSIFFIHTDFSCMHFLERIRGKVGLTVLPKTLW